MPPEVPPTDTEDVPENHGESPEDLSAAVERVQGETSTTELVEVFPGVVAVVGALPAELELVLEPLNSGLLSTIDHDHITNALATLGGTATVGGNLAQAAVSMQGLYRMADESRALLAAGGSLAVKDGKNLGTILLGPKNGFAQARFTPAAGLTAAQTAAAVGPALAMLALQTQLNEVSSLVQKNIELTHQVIENTRREERARLMSLIDTVDQALKDAQAAESVPASLWSTFAGKKADLAAERRKYRGNVEDHVKNITGAGVRQRREYLQANAQAIVFDAFALLSSLKAWVGYQALAAAVAREAGASDPAEARHFESIVTNTRRDFADDLEEVTKLLGALTRELRIIAELPGPTSLKLSSKRKDIDATRRLASTILKAIAPLSDALAPAREPLSAPEVVCAAPEAVIDSHLGVLRWLLEPEEELRVLGFGPRVPAHGRVGAVVDAAKDKLASALDRDPNRVMVVVTDRRILSARTNDFLQEALFAKDVDLADVRYVRLIPGDGACESRVDVITRDQNLDWYFAPEVDAQAVQSLAALLAESMVLPEHERDDLRRGADNRPPGQTTSATRDGGRSELVSSEAVRPTDAQASE